MNVLNNILKTRDYKMFSFSDTIYLYNVLFPPFLLLHLFFILFLFFWTFDCKNINLFIIFYDSNTWYISHYRFWVKQRNIGFIIIMCLAYVCIIFSDDKIQQTFWSKRYFLYGKFVVVGTLKSSFFHLSSTFLKNIGKLPL